MPALLHLLLPVVIALAWAMASQAAELDGPVYLTFYDVGQGDALLVHQPDRCAILVDAGPAGSGTAIGASLAEKGIFRLNRLIVTHPHQDHFGGVMTLPTDLDIDLINDNGVANLDETGFSSYRDWRADKPYAPLRAGDAWQCGDLLFTVLGPDEGMAGDKVINETSIVLRVDAGRLGVFLPGDLEAAGRRSLDARAAQLNADILKVPHHAAADYRLGEWLEAVSPELSVISVGRNNTIGAPDRQTLTEIRQKSGAVWRTDIQGPLEIMIDREGWHYARP